MKYDFGFGEKGAALRANTAEQTMRVAFLEDMREGGICDRMIREYGELASAMSQMLGMLNEKGFEDGLRGADRERYQRIMARMTTSAKRARGVIDESSELEMESHLVLSGTESTMMN
ncbi:hypothetical protein ACI3L3_13610 [Desulfobaculum sp. SPO524]|uniref:hypothetical protein n=1 Tax=Desulfobaculum sp. SPO524 TaxID=3378071 RepID=UPI0038539EF1